MHLVVLRFSAIGDVALTVPVIAQIKQTYPEVKITVVSRSFLKSLFAPIDVNFLAADLDGRHKGFAGIKRLHSDIKKLNPDKIIDLHGVLRTHVLRRFFRLSRTPFFRIDKGREGKKELTRKENKIWKQQKHSTFRYAEVFAQAGFPIDWQTDKIPELKYANLKADDVWNEIKTESKAVVGIAPLTTFEGKTWPWQKIEELVKQLCDQQIQVVLFGGPGDKDTLDKLSRNKTLVSNIAGRLFFDAEITLMKKLDAMISMDSSNMHLATLAGIPVVSVWGATHTLAGFGPLGKNEHLIAEVPKEELICRPCSVFGNKPCFRGDYACLNYLSSQSVLEKVMLAIKQKQ